MYFVIPERRTDHLTRAIVDSLIGQLRDTQRGLMLLASLRPSRTEQIDQLIARCDDEIIHYMQIEERINA